MDTDTRDAYGVDEFSARHDISRAYLYLLWNEGKAPATCRLARVA
jgi:hypothetical protein